MITPMTDESLSQPELLRYSRHLLIPEVGLEGQQKLKNAAVLVVGTRDTVHSVLFLVLDFLCVVPIGFPGIVLAMGVLITYIKTPIYATMWILLLGYITRFFPYGQRNIASVMLAISEELEGRGEVLATTAFNVYEALLGVHSIRDRSQRTKLLDLYARVFARLVVLPVSLEDASKAAELGGELRRRGHDVGADSLTAAIAMRSGSDGVVTRNVAHFERLTELTGLEVVPY